MKKAGYTLSELLIVLSIACLMFVIVPKVEQHQLQTYQEALFFSEFENLFKMSQTSAIAMGKSSFIFFYNKPLDRIKFTIQGDEKLSQTIYLPEDLHILNWNYMVLKSQTGNANKFKPIIFYNQKEQIIYRFQLGGARFYVEKKEL